MQMHGVFYFNFCHNKNYYNEFCGLTMEKRENMSFHGQSVLPAVRDMKQLEKFLVSNYEYGVLLDNQVGMLKGIMKEVHRHEKKLIIHLDLIHGLKHDEYAVDFLCQEFKPRGNYFDKNKRYFKS